MASAVGAGTGLAAERLRRLTSVGSGNLSSEAAALATVGEDMDAPAAAQAVQQLTRVSSGANGATVKPRGSLARASLSIGGVGPSPATSAPGDSGGAAAARYLPAFALNAAHVLYLAGEGQLGPLKDLIRSDPLLVNCADYDRRTPLHLAASEGRLEVVEWLLANGALVNAADRWNGTALQDAIRHKHAAVKEMLVAAGGEVGEGGTSIAGTTASLTQARASKSAEVLQVAGEGDLSRMRELYIDDESVINCEDYDRRAPLHLAASEGRDDMLRWLLLKGAFVNVTDRWKSTPLQDAVRGGHESAAEILRAAGGEILSDAAGHAGGRGAEQTTTQKVAEVLQLAGDGHVVQLMEMFDCDPGIINLADYDARTPLHLAASEGREDTVKWLLSKSAKVNTLDRWNGTPLSDAIRSKRAKIVAMLVKAGGLLWDNGSLISYEDQRLQQSGLSKAEMARWEIAVEELRSDKKVLQSRTLETIGPMLRMRWRGTKVAVRKLHSSLMKDDAALKAFRLELQIMSQIAHPHVIQFLGACTRVPPLYLVTEFLGGGTLGALLRDRRASGLGLSPGRMLEYALGIARAMAYCHGRTPEAVVHRDLNPDSILLSAGRDIVKVAGFGCGRTTRFAADDLNSLAGRVGGPLYMAPEMYKGQKYSFKVDVYSYAMILYEIFENARPFGAGDYDDDQSLEKLAARAAEGARPAISRSPPSVRTVIEACWVPMAERRPPFEDVVTLLEAAAAELGDAEAAEQSQAAQKACCGLGGVCGVQ